MHVIVHGCIYMCLCVLVCVNFGDEILLRGKRNVKPGKNSIFLKKKKVKNSNFDWKPGNFLKLG